MKTPRNGLLQGGTMDGASRPTGKLAPNKIDQHCTYGEKATFDGGNKGVDLVLFWA